MSEPKKDQAPKKQGQAKNEAPAIDYAKKFGIKPARPLEPKSGILVVDDQQDLRLIVAHHLSKLQYNKVYQAGNGIEALEVIRSHPTIAVIICDLQMPGMSGLELLQEMRETVDIQRAPFCISIENVSRDKIMLCVEHGVDEILVKPFTLGDIIPKMRSAHKVFNNATNPEPVYELAKRCLQEKELDKASAIYGELIKVTKAARPHIGLARIAQERGNTDEALAHLDRAEETNPNYVHIYSERGNIFAAQEKWQEAIEQYNKGIELSPLNPIRYIKAVEVMMNQKKYEESIALLQEAVRKEMSFPALYKYLSQACFQLKKFKEAIRYIRQALQQDPENLEFMNQLAISYKESDKLEEAQKTYNAIIKIDPDNLQALFNKAVMLQKKGSLDEALKGLEKIVLKFPDFAQGKTKLEEVKSQLKEGAA